MPNNKQMEQQRNYKNEKIALYTAAGYHCKSNTMHPEPSDKLRCKGKCGHTHPTQQTRDELRVVLYMSLGRIDAAKRTSDAIRAAKDAVEIATKAAEAAKVADNKIAEEAAAQAAAAAQAEVDQQTAILFQQWNEFQTALAVDAAVTHAMYVMFTELFPSMPAECGVVTVAEATPVVSAEAPAEPKPAACGGAGAASVLSAGPLGCAKIADWGDLVLCL
jgi:hypothetical protein